MVASLGSSRFLVLGPSSFKVITDSLRVALVVVIGCPPEVCIVSCHHAVPVGFQVITVRPSEVKDPARSYGSFSKKWK